MSAYQNTIPFFVCQENYKQCIQNHPNDLDGQNQCKENAKCGTLNATAMEDSASTTTAAASSTTFSTATSTPTAQTTSTSATATATASKAAAAAVRVAQDHSTGLFVAALLAACRLIL